MRDILDRNLMLLNMQEESCALNLVKLGTTLTKINWYFYVTLGYYVLLLL